MSPQSFLLLVSGIWLRAQAQPWWSRSRSFESNLDWIGSQNRTQRFVYIQFTCRTESVRIWISSQRLTKLNHWTETCATRNELWSEPISRQEYYKTHWKYVDDLIKWQIYQHAYKKDLVITCTKPNLIRISVHLGSCESCSKWDELQYTTL